MNKPIILVDFSKVISPIGISRHLSNILSQYVSLSRDEIRAMYKSHIWLLVKGEFPIMNFVKELLPFLKPTYTEQDLINGIKAVPPISHQFLNTLKVLKKNSPSLFSFRYLSWTWEAGGKKIISIFWPLYFFFSRRI